MNRDVASAMAGRCVTLAAGMTRYELAERIGAGGMAEIFRGTAIAAGGFEKPVAIKRILPHLSQDERFVELLIAEAHILSHLRHRNIVQIFDVGLGPDGQYFLVIEFVDGADLGKIQTSLEDENRVLPTDLGLYIGAEICDALEYAHTAPGPDDQPMRLVHRDVSPTNVLISRSGEVKLTDFGIAKRTEEVTGHGTVRGKFAYISPEQAINAHVDARSDVFSAGIMLYEFLLGRRLFSQMADFDALRAVRAAEVPRPMQVAPGIDPRLDQLLCKALAKNPDNRFASAGDMSRALRELRYSIPATGGDPAQELGALIERYKQPTQAPPDQPTNEFEEPTVILDSRHSQFALSVDSGVDDSRSYMDARQVLSSFEEEVTRAVYDPSLLSRNRRDADLDDDLDADLDAVTRTDDGLDSLRTPESENNDDEATMVGTLKGMRKKLRDDVDEERPTKLISSVVPSTGMPSLAGSGSSLPVVVGDTSGPRDHAELSGELGGSGGDGAELEMPTIDRVLTGTTGDPAASGHHNLGLAPVSSGSNSALPLPAAAMNPYPSVYSQIAMADAARARRKKMFIGVLVGCGVLLLLLVVGLTGGGDGEAAQSDETVMDAGLPVDAGVPADAPVDATTAEDDAEAKKRAAAKKKKRAAAARKKRRRAAAAKKRRAAAAKKKRAAAAKKKRDAAKKKTR